MNSNRPHPLKKFIVSELSFIYILLKAIPAQLPADPERRQRRRPRGSDHGAGHHQRALPVGGAPGRPVRSHAGVRRRRHPASLVATRPGEEEEEEEEEKETPTTGSLSRRRPVAEKAATNGPLLTGDTAAFSLTFVVKNPRVMIERLNYFLIDVPQGTPQPFCHIH